MSSIRTQRLTDREEQAWRLRLQGKTEREIAAIIDMTPSGVHRLLERVETAALADAKRYVMQVKAREHGRIEYVMREAFAAFERSKQPGGKRVREVARPHAAEGEAGATSSKVRDESFNRDGDPAWLTVILQAHDRLAALWGLNAPTKLAVQRDPDPAEQLSDAELLRAVEQEIREERRKLGLPEVEMTP